MPGIALTLYSRPGCHLCDDMKAMIDRVSLLFPLRLTIVDISADAELEQRYGLEIPVLVIDGKKVAKFRLSEEELTRILAARVSTGGTGEAGEPGRAGKN